mmetsp:Transcript_22536/g.40078  ORF Transcript_22536/g.40078 Transcript_22536/m.40078 type:complete len:118 (+) Transcript_22536:917-1270(+)
MESLVKYDQWGIVQDHAGGTIRSHRINTAYHTLVLIFSFCIRTLGDNEGVDVTVTGKAPDADRNLMFKIDEKLMTMSQRCVFQDAKGAIIGQICKNKISVLSATWTSAQWTARKIVS